MTDENIRVLKVAPGKAPEAVAIPNTLEAMQQMVGGYIEVIPLEDVCLVCNEEGKLMGLPGSRRLGDDIIAGTFFRGYPGRTLLFPDPGAGRPLGPALCPAGGIPAR